MHRTQDWLLNCIHQVCWIFVPRYHMRLVPPRMKLKGSCRMWRFRYGGRRPHVLSHVITCLHILHIWSLKESVACDDSDTEAEGKMSSHAITKARSFSCKAFTCDSQQSHHKICHMRPVKYGRTKPSYVSISYEGWEDLGLCIPSHVRPACHGGRRPNKRRRIRPLMRKWDEALCHVWSLTCEDW